MSLKRKYDKICDEFCEEVCDKKVGSLGRLLERLWRYENDNKPIRDLYWRSMMKLVGLRGANGYTVDDAATRLLVAIMAIDRPEFVALLRAADAAADAAVDAAVDAAIEDAVSNAVFDSAYLIIESYHVGSVLPHRRGLVNQRLPAARLPQVAALLHRLNWQLRCAAAVYPPAAEAFLAQVVSAERAMIEFSAACQQLPGYSESPLLAP